jgi:4,5-dihydroxyphthalate decarboxylase
VNEPGRREKVALELPSGMRLDVVADRSLSEMLLAGDLDAVLSARAPAPFIAADPRIRRLFADHRDVETAYARKTGIFPIMHVVALRRDVFDRHRWLAMNLFKAFDQARRRSLDRLADVTASHFPLPWAPDELERARDLFGADPWPYGVERQPHDARRVPDYAFEQGVCRRRLEPETCFRRRCRRRSASDARHRSSARPASQAAPVRVKPFDLRAFESRHVALDRVADPVCRYARWR